MEGQKLMLMLPAYATQMQHEHRRGAQALYLKTWGSSAYNCGLYMISQLCEQMWVICDQSVVHTIVGYI